MLTEEQTPCWTDKEVSLVHWLGPLPYNVVINGIFWFANHTKICKYADNTTVFACHSELKFVTQQVEDDCSVIDCKMVF